MRVEVLPTNWNKSINEITMELVDSGFDVDHYHIVVTCGNCEYVYHINGNGIFSKKIPTVQLNDDKCKITEIVADTAHPLDLGME